MKHITFKFADAMSNWQWITRECWVSSLEECIRLYGLNESDVEYEIISVEDCE